MAGQHAVTGRERGSVRRPLLTTIIALGSVISLAGTTGIFAVFSDRATTGTNSATTDDLPRAADLQLAIGNPQPGDIITCGTYSDDLESGIMTATNVVPTQALGSTWLCVKNVGSQTLIVAASAISLTDFETDCTGDENSVDTTCGIGVDPEPQVGELSPLLDVRVTVADCAATNDYTQHTAVALPDFTDELLPSLAPGEVHCLNFGLFYNPTEEEAQGAQTDSTTWKYALDGATSTV